MENLSQTDVILSKCRLFHIIFVVTHGEIFSHLGHTGPLTVNKMALPLMYRWRWPHIHAFIGRNTIALRVQRFAAGANVTCLTYATDMVLWSTVSQNLRPFGAARTMWVYYTLCQQSTLKSQNSGCACIGGFGQTDGQRKFELGIPKSRVHLILDACLILETRRYITFYVQKHIAHLVALFLFPLVCDRPLGGPTFVKLPYCCDMIGPKWAFLIGSCLDLEQCIDSKTRLTQEWQDILIEFTTTIKSTVKNQGCTLFVPLFI